MALHFLEVTALSLVVGEFFCEDVVLLAVGADEAHLVDVDGVGTGPALEGVAAAKRTLVLYGFLGAYKTGSAEQFVALAVHADDCVEGILATNLAHHVLLVQ